MKTPFKPFTPKKPCALRDGTPARVICTDRKGRYPIVALLFEKSANEEVTASFEPDGTAVNGNYRNSLVNVAERTSMYRNVYVDRAAPIGAFSYNSKEAANDPNNKKAKVSHLGFLELLYEDGELVDLVFHRTTN